MKIQGMRRFSKKTRLQADSVPEITEAFEEVVLGLSRPIKFDGGKLRQGHVLNALIYSFAQMDPAEREYITAEAVARLELLLAETEEERKAATERLAAIEREGRPRLVATRDEIEADEKRRKGQNRPPRKGKKSEHGDCDNKGAEGRSVPKLAH